MTFLFDQSLNPMTGDERLNRGKIYLDSSQIITSQLPAGYKYGLVLKGNLPTACHQPRLVISPLLDQRKIEVTAYTVINPEDICAQVLKQFKTIIYFPFLESGIYLVSINNKETIQLSF